MKKLLTILAFICSTTITHAQSVGINTTPAASAALDVSSSSKGMLVPRMTTAQRDAIASPATGLMVYNTTVNAFQFYNGTAWSAVGGTAFSAGTGLGIVKDGTGATLGTAMNISQATITVLSPNGYYYDMNWDGTLTTSNTQWSLAGCTGTPYFTTSTKRPAKWITVSGVGNLYVGANPDANGLVTPTVVTTNSAITSLGSCNSPASGSGTRLELMAITRATAGIPATITQPITIQ